jgi:hypothetical protein
MTPTEREWKIEVRRRGGLLEYKDPKLFPELWNTPGVQSFVFGVSSSRPKF